MKEKLASANLSSMVQAANAGSAKNESFVEMLAAQTLHADASGSLLAKKPEIDFLLRLAGTTQIARAIREHGAKEGAPFLLVVAARTPVRGPSEVSGLELPRRDLSLAELARVEKAALLSAQRA
ncbi:MAG: hypothetical protein JRN24_03390 [Nitrososphaerota archaeon]|nr:hypothetical protein [Nitrososphaerota archaeon]